MNNRSIAISLAIAAVLFMTLNFALDHNAGTVFVVLSVVSGLTSFFLFAKSRE